ncbi:hypothetical protein, partial [Pseudovibrio sp. W74]|uniref:hypothetical protein n=1 Tax=Pseudovibrio sp. W74 TaxID=1735584 RepID=UPI000A8725C9
HCYELSAAKIKSLHKRGVKQNSRVADLVSAGIPHANIPNLAGLGNIAQLFSQIQQSGFVFDDLVSSIQHCGLPSF